MPNNLAFNCARKSEDCDDRGGELGEEGSKGSDGAGWFDGFGGRFKDGFDGLEEELEDQLRRGIGR